MIEDSSPTPTPRANGAAARTGVLVALSAMGVAAVAAVLISRGPGPPPGSEERRLVVVAPATPPGDTALERVGQDLATLLAWRLDGVGDLRAAGVVALPGAATIGVVAHPAAADREAAIVLRGRLVPDGHALRLELLVEDGAAPRSPAEVHVPVVADALLEAADSAASAVLRRLWRDRAPPAPDPGWVGSRPLPALRSFLDGERALLAGDRGSAGRHFRDAIDADSSFWLAHWRYIQSQFEAPVDSAIWSVVLEHRSTFPVADRALIEATIEPELADRLEALKAAAVRYPYYWPAWWEYADALVHDGPLVGYEASDGLAALDRALSLNPRLHPAWEHTFWLAAKGGDSALATEALRRARDTRTRGAPRGVSDVRELYGFVERLMAAGGTAAEDATRELAESVVRIAPAGGEAFDHVLSYGHPIAEIALTRRILERADAIELRKAQRLSSASAWAARGAWDSALVAIDSLVTLHPEPATMLEALRLATVGVWIGGAAAEVMGRHRASTARIEARLSEAEKAELAWLDGLAAFLRRDDPGINEARLRLAEATHPVSTELERSLRGFQLALAGEEVRGARLLRRLEGDRATRLSSSERAPIDPPYLTTVNRLSAAQWFIRHGRSSDALPLLVWTERVPRRPLRRSGLADATFAAVAKLQRARAELELRLNADARRHFGEFLSLYDMPGDNHVAWVRDARDARERLAGQARSAVDR